MCLYCPVQHYLSYLRLRDKNKYMIRYLLFYTLYISFSFLHAQNTPRIDKSYEDVVYLVNGNVLRGVISEHKPDVALVIETNDGNRWTVSYHEIKKIKLEPKEGIEPKSKEPITFPQKGYAGTVQLSLLFSNGNPQYELGVIPGLYTTQGYRLHRLLTTSLGVGLDRFDRGLVLPVFVDIRGDLVAEKKVATHYYLRSGYGFPLHEGREVVFWNNGNRVTERGETQGGFYGGGGLGLVIHTSQDISWLVTLGYHYQLYHESYSGLRWENERIEEKLTIQRIAFSLGLSF